MSKAGGIEENGGATKTSKIEKASLCRCHVTLDRQGSLRRERRDAPITKMLTMSTLMMPTTMTTMTNPGPIPAHSVPQKIEPPKLTAAATLAHTTTAANKSAMEEAGGKKESYNHRHEEKTSLMVETRLAEIQGDF
uniref:Uncharacterized protein n=1 Tax=Vespula pensylvanica TaxID=30213 RepID=A0A834P8S1_VESPE|nr:hypothetical protein H0235_004649 [Vespula pensylvanica]